MFFLKEYTTILISMHVIATLFLCMKEYFELHTFYSYSSRTLRIYCLSQFHSRVRNSTYPDFNYAFIFTTACIITAHLYGITNANTL